MTIPDRIEYPKNWSSMNYKQQRRWRELLAIKQAMWIGNVGWLQRYAPCKCCCAEHTYENCIAREWFGCRGQNTMTRTEEESWARHYQVHHGMSCDEFFDIQGES